MGPNTWTMPSKAKISLIQEVVSAVDVALHALRVVSLYVPWVDAYAFIPQHNADTGATDHSCSICGKCLSSASSLDRHMLVHSGERPYKCSICGQTFTTNGNMHRYTRTQANTCVCLLCSSLLSCKAWKALNKYRGTSTQNSCCRGLVLKCSQSNPTLYWSVPTELTHTHKHVHTI